MGIAIGFAWTLALLPSLATAYVMLLRRGLRNSQVIGAAIASMRAALTAEPPPQRVLLRDIADVLVAQEHAATQVAVAVHELVLRGDHIPPAETLLVGLLSLPEPQVLVADFLREHAGGAYSGTTFTELAADMLRSATITAYSDLADQGLVELDRLLVLADEGRVANLIPASLSLALDPCPPPQEVPQVSDLDAGVMAAIVNALDSMTRRQLRLATVILSQAEAMSWPSRSGRLSATSRVKRLRRAVAFPSRLRPAPTRSDLEALAISLDAIGEIVDTARERLAEGQFLQAVHLLAGVRLPAPAGLPARTFLQESLAQARPLARFGVWHRLAVCRWTASSLQAIAGRDANPPNPTGMSTRPADAGNGQAERLTRWPIDFLHAAGNDRPRRHGRGPQSGRLATGCLPGFLT